MATAAEVPRRSRPRPASAKASDLTEIAGLARRQLEDYRAHNPGTAFAEGLTLSIDDAYEVQAKVARLREAEGEVQAGYKVGCTGPNVRRQFGMDGPIAGRLWQGEIRPNASSVSAADFRNLAIEGELAVRIGAGGVADRLFPVIELHNYVFRGSPPTLAELVANNGIHAGIVVPDGDGAGWEPGDAVEGGLEIYLDGELVESGRLDGVPGGPEGSIGWLERHLATRGDRLVPGQLVLTGAPLSLLPVTAGTSVRVVAEGIGEVSVSVVE